MIGKTVRLKDGRLGTVLSVSYNYGFLLFNLQGEDFWFLGKRTLVVEWNEIETWW